MQIAQVINDAEGVVGIAAGAHIVPGLHRLFHHRAGNGRGDAVIVQPVLGIFQTVLCVFDLIIHAVTGNGADPLAAGYAVAGHQRQAADLAGGAGGDGGAGPHLYGGLTVAGVVAHHSAGGAVPGDQTGIHGLHPDGGHFHAGGIGHGTAAHLGHRAVNIPGVTVDINFSGLAHIEITVIGVRELEVDGQVIAGADLHQFCPGVHRVAVADINLTDGAADVRRGILGLQCLRIAGLGLRFRRGNVGGVDDIKELILLHQIPLFKGVAEDLAGHQRGNGVGIGGLQSAAAGEGIGDAPLLHTGGGIGGLHLSGLGLDAAHKGGRAADDGHCRHAQHDPSSALLPGQH